MVFSSKEKEIKENNFTSLIAKYFGVFTILCFLAILALGLFLFILPKYNNILLEIASKSSQANMDYRLEKARELDELKNLLFQYEKIKKADVDKVNKLLPSNVSEEKILSRIEAIVVNNGFSLKSIGVIMDDSAVEGDASGEIGKMKVSVSIGGVNYQGLKRILSVFENDISMFDVDSLSFSPESSGLELVAHTYYLKN